MDCTKFSYFPKTTARVKQPAPGRGHRSHHLIFSVPVAKLTAHPPPYFHAHSPQPLTLTFISLRKMTQSWSLTEEGAERHRLIERERETVCLVKIYHAPVIIIECKIRNLYLVLTPSVQNHSGRKALPVDKHGQQKRKRNHKSAMLSN